MPRPIPLRFRAWGRTCPQGNIAIACGEASDIVVLDIDPRNSGDVSIRALAAKGHAFPKGPRARTGNKGWHLFFQHQAGVGSSKGKLGPGIDVKSTGGYILVAPSWTRPSRDGPGGPYVWEVSPFDVAVPRMPIWLKATLCPPPKPRPAFEPQHGGDIEHLAQFVAGSPQGERNNRLYWAACRCRELVAKHVISEASTVQRLIEAAAAAGLTGPDAPGALRTILSGLRPGATHV